MISLFLAVAYSCPAVPTTETLSRRRIWLPVYMLLRSMVTVSGWIIEAIFRTIHMSGRLYSQTLACDSVSFVIVVGPTLLLFCSVLIDGSNIVHRRRQERPPMPPMSYQLPLLPDYRPLVPAKHDFIFGHRRKT